MEIHGTTVTVCSIGPTRALPPLTASSTTIDGYSQTGASPNTSPTGADNAVITVRLDGAGFNGNGLYLSGTSGDTVQGLSVVNFHQGVAIGAANSDGTSLVGNFIGVGPNGSLQGNQSAIAFSNDRNSGIGGVTASARNIISDSAFSGIRIANSNGIRIAGNFIGTDTNDRTRAGNANGISLITVINSVIGGYDDGLRNVVSGNAGSGIAIANGTADKIVGNYIGTNRSGSATLGNGAYGIDLSQHASAVVIDRNVISHNGKAGVVLGEIGPGKAISAQIERNSMFGNKGLGIDEVPEGISNCSILLKNHFDTPPCPIIRKATATQVRGSACRGCTVEIYIATREHQNRGFGEGKKYLARVSASNGTWSLTLHAGQFDPRRQQLTATTTTTSRSSRKTSEFALNMPVKFRILNLRARFVIRHAPGIKKRPGPSIKVGIRVDWKVAAQTGIAGFNLYAGNYRLNSALIPAGRSHVHSFGAFFPTPGKVPGPSSLVVVLENGVTDKVPIRPA